LCFDEGQQAYPSGKYNDVLENLMNILEGNHKVLIFSQFVSHLDLFRTHLDKEGISYGYLTGTIGSDQRQKEIEQFQNDPATKVFLISLSAGGTGLNLTAASHVFLLDPWWNPARESQAIRRAHRIGQDKNVFAYKFITVDTVEEKILKLQQRKKQLAEDFMPSEDQLNLSNEDLEYLLE
jgi:SNF2 family DNA or RNA helicase